MNIINIASQLRFPNKIGKTLSLDQKIAIQLASLKLNSEYQFEYFNFWGRVEGVIKNYYIIEAIKFSGSLYSPQKMYFWSSQDFSFSQLPQARWQFKQNVCNMDQYFTGQHQKILIKLLDNRIKPFSQLDRLSLVVNLINYDCSVVPLGAYKMIPTKQLVKNPNFRGLKIEQSKNLSNYVHLRKSFNEQKLLLIQSGKAFQRQDFLDSLNLDEIKKSWSLQTDESKTQIIIKNLTWPGYVAYHRTNSSIYGGVYFGTGIKSQDLAFII